METVKTQRRGNEFAAAKAVLTAHDKAMETLRRELAEKCDWDDPEDVAVYRSSVRSKDRAKILDLLVPSRACPYCFKVHTSSKAWVINKKHTVACCRSCYSGNLPDKQDIILLFTLPVIRLEFDYNLFFEMRARSGLSQSRFAELAGWSQQYQNKLENGYVKTIDIEKAEMILQVFKEAGHKVTQMGDDVPS